VSRGLIVTLATTSSIAIKLAPLNSNSVTIEIISHGAIETLAKETLDDQLKRLNEFVPQSLAQLIEKKFKQKDHLWSSQ